MHRRDFDIQMFDGAAGALRWAGRCPGWVLIVAVFVLALCVFVTNAGASTGGASKTNPPLDATSTSSEARRQIEQVLDAPAFQQWRRRDHRSRGEGDGSLLPQSLSDWLEQTQQSITDWLEATFEGLFDDGSNASGGGSPPGGSTGSPSGPAGGVSLVGGLELMGWAVLALAVGFIIAMGVWLAMRRRPKKDEPGVTRQRLHDALAQGEALAADSPEWLNEADTLARKDDLRRSYRALYLALLSGLHREGMIDFRPNRTNWMYVRQFRGHEASRQRLARLTEQFDAVWYGRRHPDRAAMDRARQQVQQLLSEPLESQSEAA